MSDPAVVGHDAVLGRLRALHRDDGLSHAILLTGPEGVGKTAVAVALAATVLDAEQWPGGVRAHPDLWMEDSGEARIRLDRVRAGGGTDDTGPSLQETLSRRPWVGDRRVAVLARADRLQEEAANCLLKTLEEPPPGTHILLCSAFPERLPATIVSRCQAVALAGVPANRVAGWLSDVHGVAPETAALAAALAAGRPGRALALATTAGAMEVELAAVDALLAAAGTGRAGALRAAGTLAPPNTAEGRERALVQVAAWSAFLRDVAVTAAGAPELAVLPSYAAAAAAWAQHLTPAAVAPLLARCNDTAEQLTQYASPRPAFEVLLLDILAGPSAPPRTAPPGRPAGVPEGAAPAISSTTRRRPARR